MDGASIVADVARKTPARDSSWARSLGRILIFAALGSLTGCGEAESGPATAPEGPDLVVRELLSRLRRVHGSPAAGERVAELLWEPARKNLEARANRASAVSSRELSVGEMLAPSWLSFHLEVERLEWRQEGEWAEVRTWAPDGRSTTTRCVLEDDKWRVVLELPPVPPIRLRVDDQPTRGGATPVSADVIYPPRAP